MTIFFSVHYVVAGFLIGFGAGTGEYCAEVAGIFIWKSPYCLPPSLGFVLMRWLSMSCLI